MKVIIVVGRSKSGKTTFVKNLYKKINKPRFIYDVNREHESKTGLMPFKDFLNRAFKLVNHVIVFEEATIFLNNKQTNEPLLNLLVRKRHTNNFIILIFHSLRKVTSDALDLADYIVLFKTNDPEDVVYKKFGDNEDLINAWYYVSESENLHENITIDLIN